MAELVAAVFNGVTLVAVVAGALGVRRWVTDAASIAKDARHALELRIQAVENRADPPSGVYEGPRGR